MVGSQESPNKGTRNSVWILRASFFRGFRLVFVPSLLEALVPVRQGARLVPPGQGMMRFEATPKTWVFRRWVELEIPYKVVPKLVVNGVYNIYNPYKWLKINWVFNGLTKVISLHFYWLLYGSPFIFSPFNVHLYKGYKPLWKLFHSIL